MIQSSQWGFLFSASDKVHALTTPDVEVVYKLGISIEVLVSDKKAGYGLL